MTSSPIVISPEAWVELKSLSSCEERELKCQVQFGMSYEEVAKKYADDWLEQNVSSGKIMFTSYSFERCWNNDIVLNVTFCVNSTLSETTTPDYVLERLPVSPFIKSNWATTVTSSSNSVNTKQLSDPYAISFGSTTEITLKFVLACIDDQTIQTLALAMSKTEAYRNLKEITKGFESQIRAFKKI